METIRLFTILIIILLFNGVLCVRNHVFQEDIFETSILETSIPKEIVSGGGKGLTSEEQFEDLLYELHNYFRIKNGLEELTFSDELREYACKRAKYIEKTREFNHDNWTDFLPEKSKTSYGENLSKRDNSSDALKTISGLYLSESHHDIMLRVYWKEIAICRRGDITVVWFKGCVM